MSILEYNCYSFKSHWLHRFPRGLQTVEVWISAKRSCVSLNTSQHNQHFICLNEEALQAFWSLDGECELIKYHLRILLYVGFLHYCPSRQSAQLIDSQCLFSKGMLDLWQSLSEGLKCCNILLYAVINPVWNVVHRINASSTVKPYIIISKLTMSGILPNTRQVLLRLSCLVSVLQGLMVVLQLRNRAFEETSLRNTFNY